MELIKRKLAYKHENKFLIFKKFNKGHGCNYFQTGEMGRLTVFL